jgi:hypothetical protein
MRELGLGVYTEDLFSTGNDVDNRAAVAELPPLNSTSSGSPSSVSAETSTRPSTGSGCTREADALPVSHPLAAGVERAEKLRE